MKKYFITSVVISFLFSCSNNKHTEPCPEKMISSDMSAETSCPFLTTDNKKNIVLSWVKKVNSKNTVMCYAVSTDKGNSFGQAIEIFPSKDVEPHAENLPKIVFKPDGGIIAVWGVENFNPKNKHSGLVYYAQSYDEGKNWSKAIPLVQDSDSYDQRYFDIAILPNGEAAIIWLDNRKKTVKEGSTLYYAVTNGKDGFQNEKPIGETLCQCCRTNLFVDSKGNIHTAYRDIINDSIRDMVHIVSIDGGKIFSQPKRISADNWIIKGCPHTGPAMAENTNGLHFVWFTAGGQAGVYYCSSTDNGHRFSPRQLLSTDARNPQMTTLPDGSVCIVWGETVKKDSTFYSKIVLQLTKSDGQQTKQDITTSHVIAGMPVILSIDEKTVCVAWVQQSAGIKIKSAESKQYQYSISEQVFYRIVHIE